MPAIVQDWWAFVPLAFVLGLKHGLDADHLVAIDGLTRFNAQARPALARWCGVLFSAGHGIVVIGVALAIGIAAREWIVPGWLEDLGVWLSIAFLTALGALNLAAVVNTSPEHMVQAVAVKGRLLSRLTRTTRPAPITLVGALFALSFDTISQAALFAITSNPVGGWRLGALLGMVFTLGMMTADGANGLWIASLLRRADARARAASRVMGLIVAALSFGVAGFGTVKYFSPRIAQWSDGRELAIGTTVIATVAAAFLVAIVLARAPALQSARSARQ
jgi:high-affinity nickel-transport protein